MRNISPALLVIAFFLFSSSSFIQLFSSQKVSATITDDRLIEASGLEESYLNPGYFWTHNDSGSEAILYLIGPNGLIVMEVRLNGVENRDWEEIVTVNKGSESLIYVAETGDNRAIYENVQLICLKEPKYTGKAKVEIPETELKTMNFRYEEGARDAEALLYDTNFDEFVLVTKREENAMVYSFPFVPNQKPINIKSKGTVPSKLFTAADMNEDGEILLKHYSAIYYWEKSNERALDRILN
ncbi:hypothetical protein [Ekhidna sp.]|uniref:hypothetical protein n=1 Tax=Ekhidna sp. TaxID=2608089 RepID=UPI003B500AA9